MRTANSRIRLLIADDERLFREGLSLLLETDARFKVIGSASDGTEAITLARRLKPDVLLLDIALPGPGALETLQAVASSAVSVRTILVTPAITRADVLTALRHGARGIVLKNAPSNLLFKSIHAVM